MSTFLKFKSGLAKTRDSLFGKVRQITASKTKIDDELLGQIEDILIAGDVGVETTDSLISRLKDRVKKEKYQDTSQIYSLLKDETAALLHCGNGETASLTQIPENIRPYVILVVGVNGVGKTTTIGKLAFRYRQAGYKVIIGAADTFRAAANEQLEVWAKRADVDIIQQSHGADPAAVAFDALNSAISRQVDVVIIDTAGRLHTKKNLMEELRKIRRVMEKRLAGSPHEVLLVLDATTGQNGIQQVKFFTDSVDLTGIVLTKLDGTARGGVVLAICNELKIPVKFIGVGENLDDLQSFDRRAFVDALFEEND
jgi:fused signal recognition particle receptor